MSKWNEIGSVVCYIAIAILALVYTYAAYAEPAKRVSMQAGKSYTSTTSTKWVPR